MKDVYIGVAWPYASAPFHVGNLYGSHFPADIYRRYRSLLGDRVVMVSGSDCYGTPITLAAEKEGVTPEELAAKYHGLNAGLLQDLHIEYSLYTTTTTKNHEETVHEMFLQLLEHGFIAKETAKQLYSEKEQKFMQDRYIEGTCPYCGYTSARGDQCDGCGRLMDALSLIHPISKTTGDTLVVRETENYVLSLPKLEKDIQTWMQSKKGVWPDWIVAETLGWMKDGLHARAITRDMSYGVSLPADKIPEDMHLQDMEKKVFYVWFEAVIGYLSACKEWALLHGTRDEWKAFFHTSDADMAYFVGEDNLVFHTINWPGQLIGAHQGYQLPTHVFVNKFLMLEGQKISKSRNWIIDVQHMLDTYSLDSIRFYLAYIMTGNDQTSFRWDDFMNVNNGIFSAKIGNLIHRVLTFTSKNFGRELDETIAKDEALIKETAQTWEKVHAAYAAGKVRDAVLAIVELAEYGNEYLTKLEFWKLVKVDPHHAKEVVYSVVEIVYNLLFMLAPIVPDFSEKLAQYFGVSCKAHKGEDLLHFHSLRECSMLAEDIQPLVLQIDADVIAHEKEILGA